MKSKLLVKLRLIPNKTKIIFVLFALILVTFGLGYRLFYFISNDNNANIISNDLAYKMIITEKSNSSDIFNDNIIKVNKEAKIKSFSLNVYSLNDIDTKYGITYKICGEFDINNNECTEYIEKPKDLKIYYLEDTVYPISGNIKAKDLVLISVGIDSSNVEYETIIIGTNDEKIIEKNKGIYIEFDLIANTSDKTLVYDNPFELGSGITGGFEKDDLETIVYVDGVIISGMPTSGYYTASVNCHKKGETTTTTAIGAAIWDCSKWNLNVSNITESTVCEVNFTTSSVSSTSVPVFSYIVDGTDVGNASSSDITKTKDESKVKLVVTETKYMIYFYVSGTLTIPQGSFITDIWLLGGGGGGGNVFQYGCNDGYNNYTRYSGSGGGGGGYTTTMSNVILINSTYTITVGLGGAPGAKGGTSSISDISGATAEGGNPGGGAGSKNSPGSGGTGGAAGGRGGYPQSGANGTISAVSGQDGSFEFDDSSLTRRGGGGGGGTGGSNYGCTNLNSSQQSYGGAGGGGAGGWNGVAGANGLNGYGGGGGGRGSTNQVGGSGGSGIVIIRGTAAGVSC